MLSVPGLGPSDSGSVPARRDQLTKESRKMRQFVAFIAVCRLIATAKLIGLLSRAKSDVAPDVAVLSGPVAAARPAGLRR